MYTFGELSSRKQKHQTVQLPTDYLVLASEPAEVASSYTKVPSSHNHINRYLAKRHVMRTIRRMRGSGQNQI
jgi:hypothetical protein